MRSREYNNSSSEERQAVKRQRSDSNNLNNNSNADINSHMPQVTAADFSTIKHNNNNTPPIKDTDRGDNNNSEGMLTKFIRQKQL